MIRSSHVFRVAAALFLLGPLTVHASDLPQLDGKNAAKFAALLEISAKETLSSDETSTIDSALNDANSAVKALGLALAYRHEPEKRASLFLPMREIFHYRLPPETKVVPIAEFSSTLKQIESLNPELTPQGHTLLGYLYFREHHLQFLPPDREPVSAATVLRTAFLSSLYRDSEVDTRALIKRFYEYQSP